MRFIFLFLLATIILCSCLNGKSCKNSFVTPFPKIDTLGEFSVKGFYCLESKKEQFLNDSTLIKINVYSRVNGTKLNSGVIGFYEKDTLKSLFYENVIIKKVKTNSIVIGVYEAKHDILETRKIKLDKNSVLELNFYLGSFQQF